MAKNITKVGNNIVLNESEGISLTKLHVVRQKDAVLVESEHTSWRLPVSETTVDGVAVTDSKDLFNKILSFNDGGGNGEGVAIDTEDLSYTTLYEAEEAGNTFQLNKLIGATKVERIEMNASDYWENEFSFDPATGTVSNFDHMLGDILYITFKKY